MNKSNECYIMLNIIQLNITFFRNILKLLTVYCKVPCEATNYLFIRLMLPYKIINLIITFIAFLAQWLINKRHTVAIVYIFYLL